MDFALKYMKLLSCGFYNPPERLLSETVGIRLDDDSLVDNAVGVIETGVRDYERLP